MSVLFALCALFCLYTYALFPLLLMLRAGGGRESVPPRPDDWPPVSIVIAARDEARCLPGKLASLAALDYPPGRLETVIVSDGSSDGTVALLTAAAADDPTIELVHYPVAAGKPTALNAGVARASGEVIVFMDARQTVSPNAVRALVTRLGDPSVGVVSGELMILGGEGGGEGGEGGEAVSIGLYWRYEKWIRRTESRLFSTTGASGALYAIRRAHWSELPADVLLDDFDVPIRLLGHGLRTVFEPAAKAFDRTEAAIAGEFRRKVRTLAGNFQSFRRHPWLFDPRRNPVWWQFLSHKVFRLFVPYALLGAFATAALGDTPLLRTMFWLQALFYASALGGCVGVDNRLSRFARTFVQLNAAAVLGAFRYATGGGVGVRWKRR